ncbi:MAG TPA: diacylglycerol kinase family protein [bacterium]|nr:diacylglycerol kinase family protein [bacterium]HOG42963.1 diacylglycerol kinase family protein [bacterium]HPV20158.1 diacylglycerol kinase family protein [bacterium]HQB08343.1 diacylglycerol kinase family protein [bacterium]
MPGIGLISNPYSRKNRKNPSRLQKLINAAPDKNLVKLPVSYDEMDTAISHFKENEIDILAINGGDGTVHVALCSLMKIYKGKDLPKLAILKGGTMNQTATNLRIKGNTVSIFKRVLEGYAKSDRSLKTKKVSLLRANDRYGFIFGNGAVCSFLDVYHRSGDPSPLVAGKAVLSTVGSIIVRGKIYKEIFTPVSQKVTVDNFCFGHSPYLATLITTIPELGLGFEVMHRSKVDHTKAHMIAFHEKAKIIMQFHRAWMGLSLPPDIADDTIGKRFVIDCEKPFKYTLDGDFYSCSGRLTIETGPVMDIIVE